MDRGDVAVALERAVILGVPFDQAGVPDTPANRDLFARIGAEVKAMPKGVVPDIPPDNAA